MDVKSKDLLDESKHFISMTKLLNGYHGSRLNELNLIQSFSNRIKILNPINSLVNNWNESVTLKNNKMQVCKTIKKSVEALEVLGKFEHFRMELFSNFIEMLRMDYCLVFKNDSISGSKSERFSPVENIEEILKFLNYLKTIGINMGTEKSKEFEIIILENYLRLGNEICFYKNKIS